MSEYVMQQMLNALILGSLYALVAVGFSLIYGVIRLINFAHGDLMMIGAFSTLGLMQIAGPLWALIPVLVLGIGFLTGSLIEKVVFRPVRNAPMITGFVVTLSLSVAIQNLGQMFLGAQPRSLRLPEFFSTRVEFAGLSMPAIDIVIPVTTAILAITLTQFIYRSRIGTAMRAVSENIVAAQLMGISINRVVMVAFGLGSALACLAGFFWGGKFGQIDPIMGLAPGLKAFIATIIGGVGSIPGAILGGFILGLAEVMFVGFLPPEYAGFRDTFVFGTLILILLIRPQGIFGIDEEERA